MKPTFIVLLTTLVLLLTWPSLQKQLIEPMGQEPWQNDVSTHESRAKKIPCWVKSQCNTAGLRETCPTKTFGSLKLCCQGCVAGKLNLWIVKYNSFCYCQIHD
ncbi:Uncharacterised protein g6546 [Pycnogonum litorale]